MFIMQDYKSRRRGLLQRMRWLIQDRIDARILAKAEARCTLKNDFLFVTVKGIK